MARTYFGYGCCCGGSGSRPEIGGSGPIWVECLQAWIPRLLFLRVKDALGRWAWSEECWPPNEDPELPNYGNPCAEFFSQTFEMHYVGNGEWRAVAGEFFQQDSPNASCVLDVTMHTGRYLHLSGSYVECIQISGYIQAGGYGESVNFRNDIDNTPDPETFSLVPFVANFLGALDTCGGYYYISEDP